MEPNLIVLSARDSTQMNAFKGLNCKEIDLRQEAEEILVIVSRNFKSEHWLELSKEAQAQMFTEARTLLLSPLVLYRDKQQLFRALRQFSSNDYIKSAERILRTQLPKKRTLLSTIEPQLSSSKSQVEDSRFAATTTTGIR